MALEYLSKTFCLDEEVLGWLEKLRELHGSVNKGLRLVAFPNSGDGPLQSPATPAAATTKPKKLNKQEKVIRERAASDVTAQAVARDDVDYSDVESTPSTHIASLRGSMAAASATTQKTVEKWREKRRKRGELTKPKDRK